ncbi:MAG: hypothetical protein WC220_00990 [Pedobacter sp.]
MRHTHLFYIRQVNYELRKLSYDLHETVRDIRKSAILDSYADSILNGLPG